MQNTSFGGHYIFAFSVFHHIFQQHGRRANHVGHLQHWPFTLRMSQHQCLWMLLLQLDNGIHRETLMHMTTTLPQQHIAARDGIDIRAQIIVRSENNFLILRERVHYLLRIATGYHHIGQCFHGRRGVHIAHHLVARMLLLVSLQILSLAAVSQRAACIQVRTEHQLVGRQQLAGLCHEVHASHDDDLRIRLCRLAGQRQ